MCIGFNHPGDLVGVVLRLMAAPVGPGRPRKFVGLEMTAHPSDTAKRKNSFRSRKEMKRVTLEVVKEFHIRYALIGLHGLRDIHILAINWGPTGLALKSYLPNRSRPKRVLVAVVDRVEREINRERAAKKKALLRPMVEVQSAKRKALGRPPMHELLAKHLPLDREPEVVEILRAIRDCGWYGVVKGQKVSISFSPARLPKHFELDLFLRGARRERRLRKERREEKERLAMLEKLTKQIHHFVQHGTVASWAKTWLEFGPDGIAQTADLKGILNANTAELNEFIAALAAANVALSERSRDKDGRQPEID